MVQYCVREALATQDAGANLRNNWTQPSDVDVSGKQFQRRVEARSRFEQQRKIASEDRDVLRPWLIEKSQTESGGGAASFLGDGVDGSKPEILDAAADLGCRRRGNRAADDLAGLG